MLNKKFSFFTGVFLIGLSFQQNAFARNSECQTGPALTPLISLAAGESIACLDSLTLNKETRAIFLISAKETSTLLIADFTSDSLSTKATQTLMNQVKINEPTLFPNSCGYYLKSARILLHSNQIAAFYAHNEVRIINFTDANNIKISVVHDEHTPGAAYSCEGYSPNWSGARDGITIDSENKTITLSSFSREWSEKVEQKQLTPEQTEFYARAYREQCKGKYALRDSQECLDLKLARDEGVLNIRSLYHAKITSSFNY